MSIAAILCKLDSLPLPTHYKTPHLLDRLANLPCPDLPSAVEPVLLCSITVQSTFMPSADVLPWHPNDDDPVPVHGNRECRVRRIHINTSTLTSDLYPDTAPKLDPVFPPDVPVS